MKLKLGVKLKDLSPQMVLAAVIINNIYQALDPKASCTITSANDSKHMRKSLHYSGNALDFRTHDFKGDKSTLLKEALTNLGEDFDVVFEGVGTPQEHLHVEYQPKINKPTHGTDLRIVK